MRFRAVIILILVLLAVAGAGFYFRNNLTETYENVESNIQNFQKINFSNILSEIQKEIALPPPLQVGGPENAVILTKARIIAQTNIHRYNNGLLAPLLENSKLSLAAKIKAEDMFARQYFDHVSPSGVGPSDVVRSAGYEFIVSGENLILGNFLSEEELVQAWMDSPGHRANILNDRYTEIGVAAVKGNYKGQTVWISVQEFGLPLSSCSQPSDALKNQIDAEKANVDQLFVQIEAKRQEIEKANRRSPQYNQMVNEYNQMVSEYNDRAAVVKNLISQYNSQVNAFNQCVAGE